MTKLFRRREVWLPTPLGALLMLAAVVLVAGVLARTTYALLAPQQPARGPDGAGARTLVVEGWLNPDELRQAVAIVRNGRYERVLTTGGLIEPWPEDSAWQNIAERAAASLRASGLTSVPVIAVITPPTAQDRTFRSALAVREWAQGSGLRLDAIDLLSLGVHTRRSWKLYRMALGDEVEVGVRAAVPTTYDARLWWRSSAGAKATMGEVLSLGWTACCFWP